MELSLYTMGDSTNIDTWSNLPYFFGKALAGQGVNLNRISILREENYIHRAWQQVLSKAGRLPCHDPVSIMLIQQRIKQQSLRYAGSELNIFLTFSFTSHRYTPAPTVHYCDQTYELLCEDTGKRITALDLWLIRRENEILRSARHVFTTGTRCRDFIRYRLKQTNVSRLRTGINLDVLPKDRAPELLAAKRSRKDILFIGKGYHKRGLDVLVTAFERFNEQNHNEYTLHVVGTPPATPASLNPQIRYHGYLSKGNASQLHTYLDLLRSARMFVMPMREGPLPGVIREAGLMYTPVIITNIWNVNRFIRQGVNGLLIDVPDPHIVAERMHYLANNDHVWELLARNAHRISKRNDWNRAATVVLQTALEPNL